MVSHEGGDIDRDHQSSRKTRPYKAVEVFLITLRDPALNQSLVQISHSAWPTRSLQYAGSHKTIDFLELACHFSLFLYQNVSLSSLEGLLSLLRF